MEQGFVAAHAREKDYYPLEWIQSFKYHLRRQYVMDIFVPPLKPAPETLMVAFHGFPRPNFIVDEIKPLGRGSHAAGCTDRSG